MTSSFCSRQIRLTIPRTHRRPLSSENRSPCLSSTVGPPSPFRGFTRGCFFFLRLNDSSLTARRPGSNGQKSPLPCKAPSKILNVRGPRVRIGSQIMQNQFASGPPANLAVWGEKSTSCISGLLASTGWQLSAANWLQMGSRARENSTRFRMSDLREAAPQTRVFKNRWTEQGAINPTRQLTELVLEAGLRRRASIFVLFGP